MFHTNIAIRSAESYANELEVHGHGHPLWYPGLNDIKIGDVGYIDDDGAFQRFFNVTEEDANAQSPTEEVLAPDNFHPLALPHGLVDVTPNYIQPGVLCGKSVSHGPKAHHHGGGGGFVEASQASGTYKSSHLTSRHQGAILCLNAPATKVALKKNHFWKPYMLANHEHWYRCAVNAGFMVEKEAIILVTGYVSCPEWELATFCKTVEPDVSVSEENPGQLKLYSASWQSYGFSTRSVRPGTSTSNDRIFLSYWKMEQRMGLFPKVSAALGPHHHTDALFEA